MQSIREFLKWESAGGVLLFAAAALTMIVKNTPLAGADNQLLLLPVEVRVGPLHLAKPAVLWVNDGLMAIFFLLIGLEVKREFLEGQ